jgi:RNA-directed DNA polymerase
MNASARPLFRNLRSAEALAACLAIKPDLVRELLSEGDAAYSQYHSRILDRRIDVPCPELRSVQRTLLRRFCSALPAHRLAHGGVPGRSTFSNARVHFPARQLAKLDIHRFYPSVTRGMVRGAFQRSGLEEDAAELLIALTTTNRGLPTGAPTSPWIANLVLWPIDRHMGRFCSKHGARYSRYVDDIAISGPGSESGFHTARRAIEGLGLRCSPAKSVPRCPRDLPIEVTGYVVNGEALTPPEGYLAWVRASVERFLTADSTPKEVSESELAVVMGHIAYLQQTCPQVARELTQKLTAAALPVHADWPT